MTRMRGPLSHRCALEAAESRRRPAAMVELIATIALALSTVVAVTAVSIGIARADVFGIRADGDTGAARDRAADRSVAVGDGRAHRHDGGRPEGESVSSVCILRNFCCQARVVMLESLPGGA